MGLYCKSCGEQIPAEDVNIDLAIAKCRSCNAVFGFGDQLVGDATSARRMRREPVGMPKGITVETWGRELTITRRWFSGVFVVFLFLCAGWDSFLVFWYGMAISENAPWIAVVFPVAHVAIGVGLTYYTIAGFLNRTVISVSSGELRVRHGPLPWSGNHTIPAAELNQAYCVERSAGSDSPSTYELHALLTDGRKLKLLTDLPEADQALFIEQELEDHLGIEDRPVRGELR